MTTDDLDRVVHERCVAVHRVYPSPLFYNEFPKSLCVSINEVVCHGIPDDTVIESGDLVKLDVSVYVAGYHGDTCRTVIAGGAGATDVAGRRLVATTRQALNGAVALCGPGVRIAAIGDYIQPLLEDAGYAPVREFAGHGIGTFFHTQPLVYHHRNDSPFVMRPGMTFTIEPMVVEGASRIIMWPDKWTVVTADCKRAAQFEHTLLITPDGADVLTAYGE